jgi:NAD(P)-dependent dehydrogenase (short-subunit alcohol dehydrogenase family)
MAGQVAGKVALVTGGASGIGEAVSELLAREGASVAVTDIDELRGPQLVARIKKAGGEATFWHQDVTSEERWIEVVPRWSRAMAGSTSSSPMPVSALGRRALSK